ncbi:Kinesin-like protein kif24 [Mactra antiquata]
MGTLFECLREAKLERYYPSFRAQGITKSEALTRLNINDCHIFGITSQDDKKRLAELISIVKAVHNVSDRDISHSPASRDLHHSRNKIPRKRNRSPTQTSQQFVGRGLSASHDVPVRDRSRTTASSHHLSAAGAAILDLISDEDTSEESSGDSGEHSDYEPAVKHSVTTSVVKEFPGRIRKTPVEKIKYGAGYNYGVPGGGTGVRPKGRPGSGRLHEDKIKVCVRKRPLSKREIRSGEEDMIQAASTTTLVVSEPKQAVDLTAYTLQHEFIFDEVFEEKCTNEDVYIRAARPLISCIFDGGSATCFAYGQTGAGKTHTMIGNREVPGLYLLAAHDIFSIIEARQYGSGIKVWVSFFEIYCGQLFDLLNKRNRLHAREDGSHRVCIAGLTETEATDEQSLMQVLEYGNSVRSKGATGVNPDSSRSHAVLQMEIRDRADKRLGRISFIDLAGSERASDSADTDKQTRMEGAEINQSLLALKECIRSIDQESRHKPFRQSKLTHILKDSFIGNSKTCMIANISPASSSCEHTLNTLRYADRVKELRRGSRGSSPSTSRSTNVAMSNILMNIPASAPSIFQPSSILCSSTPMKQTSRSFTNRNNSADIQLDPAETPIRGPGARRKTATAASRSEYNTSRSQSQGSSSSQRVSANSVSNISRSQVTRHFAPNVKTENKQNVSSNSESDQTESDSCNMTGPQKPVNLPNQMKNNNVKSAVSKNSGGDKNMNLRGEVHNAGRNIAVVKSSDTDNDFPTTDFNNEEALNDLNRTDGKNNVAASVPVFPSMNSKQIEADSKPVSQGYSQQQTGYSVPSQARSASVSASVPVLRKKIYTENMNGEEKENQSEGMTNKTPDHDTRLENYASESQTHRSDFTKTPISGNDAEKHSSITKTKDLDRDTKPEVERPRLRIPSSLTSSFNDDLLFDPPSIDQRVWTPRTPSENSGTQPRIPQDPSLQPEIPAVLPAKSTELTTFSQSPRWQLNKNQNNYQIPAQPNKGYHPEPIRTIPKGKPDHRAQNSDVQSNPWNLQPESRPAETQVFSHTSSGFQQDISAGAASKKSVAESSKLNSNTKNTDEKEPVSANWFTTPADHDTHVAASVSKKPTTSGRIIDKKSRDPQDPEISDPNDKSYPIQRNGDKNRSEHSDSGILSAVSDTEIKYSQYTNRDSERAGGSASGYKNSDFARPGYFSDFGSGKRNGVNDIPTKHRVVHSPVNTRQSSNHSPVIRDYVSASPFGEHSVNSQASNDREYNSESPYAGKSGNGALKTEKLGKVGSTFSPIHPQPVTNSKVCKSIAVSKDIVHPTPVSKVSASTDTTRTSEHSTSHTSDQSNNEVIDLKTQLISSHEDQLATVTSLCKQEMKLLLGAKAGSKKFDEYMKRVSEVLTQKMSAIQILQDQIIAYQLSTQD